MNYLVLVIVLAVIAVLWHLHWEFNRLRDLHEEIVALLERDRDQAKQETRVFRNLLFPAIERAEKGAHSSLAENGEKIPGRSSTPFQAMPARGDANPQSFYRPRVPFRIRFNQARKLMNSKQQTTDALASRLPSGEKKHAT